MTLEHDPRTGYEDSGTVTVTQANGAEPQTAFQPPSDALFKPTRVKIEYPSAGATTDVALHDDADGTGSGDVSDAVDTFANLSAADSADTFEGPWRAFDEDVLVAGDDNQDDDIEVTVYGVVLTDLKDVSGF